MHSRETPYSFVLLCIFPLSPQLPLMCISNLMLLPHVCVTPQLVSHRGRASHPPEELICCLLASQVSQTGEAILYFMDCNLVSSLSDSDAMVTALAPPNCQQKSYCWSEVWQDRLDFWLTATPNYKSHTKPWQSRNLVPLFLEMCGVSPVRRSLFCGYSPGVKWRYLCPLSSFWWKVTFDS